MPPHPRYSNQINYHSSICTRPHPPSDNHIHFIPYGLLQTTDTTVKIKTTQQNRFPAQSGIVPILNITQDTMNSGLKERLLAIPSIIGLEPTYLTTKSGKWLVIVKKNRKDQSRTDIDKTINDTIFPDSQIEQPGHSNHHNIDFVLVYYTAALQRDQLLRPSNSTIHHNMQLNTTSVPHTMSTISISFQTSEKKRKNITKKNKRYTFDHHQYYRFHLQ